MSPYLITFFLSLQLFFSTFASKIVTRKRNPDETDRFYCDFRLFEREYIEASKSKALKKFSHDAISLSEGSSSKYPEIYSRPLGFENEETYLIWPLSDPVLSKYIKDLPPVYFLAIGSISMDAVGIVKKQFDKKDHIETYVRCKTSKFAEPFVKTGYRCPAEIFPREVLKLALMELKYERITRPMKTIVKEGFPSAFNGKILYNLDNPLYLWPIDTHGSFAINAPTYLVLDPHDNIMGMIHDKSKNIFNRKGIGIFLKCLPMSLPKIIPQLIGLDLPQPTKKPNWEVMDVFQCGASYFDTRKLLKDAFYAADGFVAATKQKRVYPKSVGKLFLDGEDEIYLWPALYSRKNNYPPHFKSVIISTTAFLKITDFCDIIGVVYFAGNDQIEQPCTRKFIPKDDFILFREGYVRTPKPQIPQIQGDNIHLP